VREFPQEMFEEITIQHLNVSAKVAPQRGALVTSLTCRGGELLYLDRETFADSSKNVRGGIPVLFPFAGRLNDGIFEAAGTKMNQHGFGRNMSWRVVERRPYLVRMALLSDKETLAQYPYSFVAEQSCLIVPNGLQIELLICNMDAKPMPVSPGWHPYFSCPADQKQQVTTRMPGWDASRLSNDKEFDFGLPASQNGRATFKIPRLGTMEMGFNPRMRHLQFWSLPGKPFICIEPFLGPNNTINTASRMDVPPGEARTFWMRIEVSG
jgi:galactose mutarotase-like enzyme